MLSSTSLCPSRFCTAQNPAQELVNLRQAEAVNEPALEGAIRCSGCGCVWVRQPNGNGHVLGTLRKLGRHYDWKSPYKRPQQPQQG
jgi:hypothetical protein